jgi:cell division septum initiation protein DivIVA
VDVHDQLNQIAATVRGAKAMPMSASCLVNRAELLDALERVRDVLPVDLDQADALLSERDAVVAAGRSEADQLVEDAHAERELLIEQTDVLVAARERAGAVAAQARAEATRLLADADDYVDRKLGEFEVVLGQLGSQVNNGRERLAARREADLARVEAEVERAAEATADSRSSSEPIEVAAPPCVLSEVDAAFGRTPSPPLT